MEKQVRPEDWHNIPKCVVEAVRYLMDRIKFESGKIGIHQELINRMQDSTARKETKVERKFDDMNR